MRAVLPIVVVILTAILLSSAPYMAGYSGQQSNLHFMGLTHNIDDAYVYLSWMRQTADGAVLIRNQFTVEPQAHLQFNLLFLLLGWIARAFNAPLIAVFHAARIAFGAGLLLMIYHFGSLFLTKRDQRIALLVIVAFSSGIGWLFQEDMGRAIPVDMWQPEAITLLSLYLNPLFLCAQILMLASLLFLMRSRDTGKWQDGAVAGIFLLLLANIHTYDVVTVAVVWAAFLVADTAAARKPDMRLIGTSVLAGLIASPALLYQLYLYHSEVVFRLRANTPATSPPLWAFLAGYGVVLALALFGLAIAFRRRGNTLLPAVWAIVGFALPYLPVAQQRKLIMGLHIPLAILAVVALTWLAQRRKWSIIATSVVVALIAIPSNLLFMSKDVDMLVHNQTAALYRPKLSSNELSAMRWLRSNTQRTDTVLALPSIACFIPALTGNRVYLGHWSETPAYYEKLREFRTFADGSTPDSERLQILRRSRADYLWWDMRVKEVASEAPDAPPVPAFAPDKAAYLTEVFGAGSIRVYRVVLGDQRRS